MNAAKPVTNTDPDTRRRAGGVCDVCHRGVLYLVRLTPISGGPLVGYRVCATCKETYLAARAAGRVP